MFAGFPEETIRFFLDLRFHNEISYYKAHENEYLAYVKEPFHQFIEAMAPTMLSIDPSMDLRPGRSMARIRRDVRFSKDKSPFRDHMWCLFRRSGEKRDTSVTFWFELSPQVVEWGLGFWSQNRPAMDALRRMMTVKPSVVADVFHQCEVPSKRFHLYGDRYKRMIAPEHLPIDLAMIYPMKELYLKRIDVPLQTAFTADVLSMVQNDFLRLAPLYRLLREAADEGMAQLDS